MSTLEETDSPSEMHAAPVLSPAQRRVLVALCRPLKHATAPVTLATNKDIAAELVVGVDAVKANLRGLFVSFRIEDVPQNRKRARLVELAFKTGAVTSAGPMSGSGSGCLRLLGHAELAPPTAQSWLAVRTGSVIRRRFFMLSPTESFSRSGRRLARARRTPSSATCRAVRPPGLMPPSSCCCSSKGAARQRFRSAPKMPTTRR